MADDLKELERQRAEINERIGEIEWARDEQASAQFVGRYFKYRNSYSCPEGPGDYWMLYFKCTGYEGKRLTGYSFQTDSSGKFFFEPDAGTYNHLTGYEEIDASEFVIARASFLSELNQAAML